jgi:hypothetical protein
MRFRHADIGAIIVSRSSERVRFDQELTLAGVRGKDVQTQNLLGAQLGPLKASRRRARRSREAGRGRRYGGRAVLITSGVLVESGRHWKAA